MPATDRISGTLTSVAVKEPARVATTANITLSGEQTIDTVSVVAGDRVLVKDQTNPIENGVWVASATAWERALDWNGSYDAVQGTRVFVISGAAGGNATYYLSSSTPTIGSDSATFALAELPVQTAVTLYADRAACVTALASLSGATVLKARDTGLEWSYDGTATDYGISDMPGCRPLDDITPDHWVENTTPGTTAMSAAIQAAADYAASTSDGNFAGVGGREVRLLDTLYLMDAKVTLTNDYDYVRFRGGAGTQIVSTVNGSAFQINDDGMFGGGDTTGINPINGIEFVGIRFKASNPGATDTIAIRSGNAPDLQIRNCHFVDFWIALDWHRQNTPHVVQSRFQAVSRTNAAPAEAFIRMQGVYNSTATNTPGGGARLIDNEFLGRSSDAAAQPVCLLVKAIDTLYIRGNHLNNYSECGIKFAPDGSLQNNRITDLKSDGGNYFDGGLSAGARDISLEGTVGWSSGVNEGLYQNIQLKNDFLRGGGVADYGLVVSVTDGGGFEAEKGGIKGVSIVGCEIGQHKVTSLALNGTSNTRIPCVNPTISSNIFYEGRKNGTTGGTSYLDIDAKGLTAIGNTANVEDNAPNYAFNINTSNYTDVGVVIAGNNLTDSTASLQPIVTNFSATTAAAKGENITSVGPDTDGEVLLEHFGANKTPGTTDMRAALVAALANHKEITLLGEQYRIDWDTAAVAFPAGTVLKGRPGAELILTVPDALQFYTHFTFNDNVRLENVKITFDTTVASSQHILAAWTQNGLTFKDVEFDGQITGAAGSPSHTVHLLNAVDAAGAADTVFDACYFNRITYTTLKANSVTSAHERIKYLNCTSYNVRQEDTGFNSPNGTASGIEVSGGTLRADQDTEAEHGFIRFASGQDVTIKGVNLEGPCGKAIHFEEDVKNVVMSGVNAKIDGDFLFMSSNNNHTSATYTRPERINLSGFNAEQTGATGHTGIKLVYSGTLDPANHVTITGGTLKNFDRHIEIGVDRGEDIDLSHLTLVGGNYGAYFGYEAVSGLSNITFDGQTTAIFANRGGSIHRPIFRNCTNIHEITNGVLRMHNPGFRFDEVSFGAGVSTYFRLVPGIRRLKGDLDITVYNGSATTSTTTTYVEWDNTTETVTADLVDNVGTVSSFAMLIDEVSAVAVSAGGTGYAVDDILTVSGGTLEAGGGACTVRVTSVSGGVVDGVSVENDGGEYATVPASPAATTGGTGTGCTLTLTTQKTLACRVFSSSAVNAFLSADLSGRVFV